MHLLCMFSSFSYICPGGYEETVVVADSDWRENKKGTSLYGTTLHFLNWKQSLARDYSEEQLWSTGVFQNVDFFRVIFLEGTSWWKVHHVKYQIEAHAYIIALLITKTHVVHIQLTGKGVGAHGGGRALVMWGQAQWGGQWLYQEANRAMVLISLYKSVLLYSATFCANNSIFILFLFFTEITILQLLPLTMMQLWNCAHLAGWSAGICITTM